VASVVTVATAVGCAPGTVYRQSRFAPDIEGIWNAERDEVGRVVPGESVDAACQPQASLWHYPGPIHIGPTTATVMLQPLMGSWVAECPRGYYTVAIRARHIAGCPPILEFKYPSGDWFGLVAVHGPDNVSALASQAVGTRMVRVEDLSSLPSALRTSPRSATGTESTCGSARLE
jgi:hypothetical protein